MSRHQLARVLGDETDGARAGVEAHLASCERCATSYRAMKRTVRFVRAHSRVAIEPGTPAGQYSDLTRATMDDEYGRQPVDVLIEAALAWKGQKS